MKQKEQMLALMYSILTELKDNRQLEYDYNEVRATVEDENVRKLNNAFLHNRLVAQLEILYNVLEDEVPEEYQEQIEEFI